MSSVGVMNKTQEVLEVQPVAMMLEVVLLDVADVDRAKAFYENLGWRVDIDIAHDGFRGVQVTPQNSATSIIFGKGVTARASGSALSMVLAVSDINAARADLIARGVDVSQVFHFAGGPFNHTVENPRVAGPDPQGRSYFTFASFQDPDGNNWLLQEISMRLPGREWKSAANPANTAALADLLRETAEYHDHFEKTHAEHQWWDWYAPYLSARQNGSTPEEASAAADRHMEQVLHVLPR